VARHFPDNSRVAGLIRVYCLVKGSEGFIRRELGSLAISGTSISFSLRALAMAPAIILLFTCWTRLNL